MQAAVMFWKGTAIFCFSAFLIPSVLGVLSCKDQNNNDVDWYVGYKMPRIQDGSIPGIEEGGGFYYMDLNMDSFLPSQINLNETKQAIGYTLQQYYDGKASISDFSYVLYNDEEAAAENEDEEEDPTRKIEYGHTKGVVFFDKTGGFWLIHSFPKFPSPETYIFPNNTHKLGQSFLCITFNYGELTKIGTQLFYNHPQIFASNMAPSMASENPDLAKVITLKQYKKGSPFSSTLYLQSRGGQKFQSFAKTAEFCLDLYDGLVAPSLQIPLYVETWRDGFPITLDCKSKYPVLDGITMKVGKTQEFKYTKDHSKLAVSTNSAKPIICIGDVNRMTSQFHRGGGTVCIESKKLWNNYMPMFITENSCN